MKTKAFIVALVLALTLVAHVEAASFTNLITNGSFETTTNSVTNAFPSAPYGHYSLNTGNGSISNWSISGNILHNNPQGYYARSAYQGNWSVDLTGAPTNAGSVSQVISTSTVSGGAYQYVFAMGVADDGPWGGYTPAQITVSSNISSGYSRVFNMTDTVTASGDYPGVNGIGNIIWRQQAGCISTDANNASPTITFQNSLMSGTIWGFLDDVQLYRIDNCLTPGITLSMQSAATEFVPGVPHRVVVTPNESLYGFDASDLASVIVTNGSVSNFGNADANGAYSFDVTPSAVGTTTIRIPSGVAIDNDPVPNSSTQSNTLSITVSNNSGAPQVLSGSLSVNGTFGISTPAYPTDNISFDMTTSEPVVFPNSTVTISGVAATCTNTSGNNYSCTVPASSFAVGAVIADLDVVATLYDPHLSTSTYAPTTYATTVVVSNTPATPNPQTGGPVVIGGKVITSAPIVASPTIAVGECSPIFKTNYKKGVRNQEIKVIQEFLNKQSVVSAPLVVDGVFGSGTDKAVRAFQEKYRDPVLVSVPGNRPTGWWYPNTRAKANELYCSSSR